MMNFMDVQDISFVDVDELGVRPLNWTDDGNDTDFDDTMNGYLNKEKLIKLQSINDAQKLTTDDGDCSIADEDESNYDIDPETGEKIFHEVLVSPSPSLSSSNDKWIEEYLLNIESKSNHVNSVSNSDLLFEDISFANNNNQTDSNWFSKYIPIDESTNHNNNMFQGEFIDNNEKHFLQTTSPILIPLSSRNNHNSFVNLSNISADDDHSISTCSNSSHRQRLFSSFESESTTYDSDLTFDGQFIEAKLEKIEHDEHFIPPMFMRRSSTRSNYQRQQDEDTLRRYSIPLTLYDISQSSTDDYNRHLANLNHLNPEQIHIIKDIRRRGKNKIAAQNCRKRKAHGVESLLDEVDELKRVKLELEELKKTYQQQISETRNQYEYLHHQVLPNRQLPPAIIVK